MLKKNSMGKKRVAFTCIRKDTRLFEKKFHSQNVYVAKFYCNETLHGKSTIIFFYIKTCFFCFHIPLHLVNRHCRDIAF